MDAEVCNYFTFPEQGIAVTLRPGDMFLFNLGSWPEIEGGALQPIWGSLACGRNYYLNSHLDDDFFYSLSTIASHVDYDRTLIGTVWMRKFATTSHFLSKESQSH